MKYLMVNYYERELSYDPKAIEYYSLIAKYRQDGIRVTIQL